MQTIADYAAELGAAITKGEQQQKRLDVAAIAQADIYLSDETLRRLGLDRPSADIMAETIRTIIIKAVKG